QRLFALALLATAFLLDLAERRPFFAAMDALLADGRLQRREGARNVLRHRFLIDQRLLALLPLLPFFPAALVERRSARRGGRDGARRHRSRPASPPRRRRARHGPRAHRCGYQRPPRRRGTGRGERRRPCVRRRRQREPRGWSPPLVR